MCQCAFKVSVRGKDKKMCVSSRKNDEYVRINRGRVDECV